MGLAWESIYYINTYVCICLPYTYVYAYIYTEICICICIRIGGKLSYRFLCGAVQGGAWQEDVDKNKMDNHLPYKLELENMPAIKEGKIKTAFAKGGREWEGGRERERER